MRLAVISCFVLGCFGSREPPSSIVELDASVAAPRDAARDAARDARPPLPPSDEPDVEPGERPSDDPDADEWIDPPSAGDDDPCCEVGELIGIGDLGRRGSSPVVAWNGVEWGTAWFDERVVFRRLDESARPTSELVVVPTVVAQLAEMAHGNHRFAMARAEYSGGIVVVTRDGVLLDDVTLPDGLQGRSIARFPLTHGWAAIGTRSLDGTIASGEMLVYDEGFELVARHDLGLVEPGGSGFDPAIASAKSVLVAATADPDRGTVVRTYGGRAVERQEEVLAGELGTELVATTFRDSVVVVGRTYEGAVRARVWDPFARTFLSDVVQLGRADGDQGLGVAADDRGGTLGVCRPKRLAPGEGNPDAIVFALLGPDGQSLGDPIVAGSGYDYVAACAVAAAGQDSYALLIWDAGFGVPSIRAGLVRVRR